MAKYNDGKYENFIDKDYIENLLSDAKGVSIEEIERILDKAKLSKGLNHEEVAKLLEIEDDEHLELLYEVAGEIKDKIYGNRVVLFAPLYISNFCKNNCKYCGYKRDNDFSRKRLSFDEIKEEVKVLESLGHKRLALEVGEDALNTDFDYILDSIDKIYEAGDIRRINVNIAATTVENYKKLHEKEIGTYILFQETYHPDTFEENHPKSLKGDYHRQLFAHHRAMEAGIEDVGGGVLFGLYDYKFEVLSLILHNQSLEDTFNVGFHTVSVPRIKKADGVELHDYDNYLISDRDFKKIVTILRLALPYTGIILSTRETIEMRRELIAHGVSQISAGSQTGVGGYLESIQGLEHKQFELEDERSPLEVIKDMVKLGYLPSYCTACYRMGRVGDYFMSIVKAGKIHDICTPNALLTFIEFVEDFGDDELKEMSHDLIEREIAKLKTDKLKEHIREKIDRIRNGERDLFV